MNDLLTWIRGWWRPTASAKLPISFQGTCSCGQGVAGQRQRHHQVLACPGCKQKVFVLGESPLPQPRGASWSGHGRRVPGLPAASKTPLPVGGWAFWRWPILAAGVTAILATLCVLALLSFVASPSHSVNPGDPSDSLRLVREGEQALADGRFPLAAQKLSLGLEAWGTGPPPALHEVRRVRLLVRQAELLGDLMTESLADVVHLAMVDEKQWPDQFTRRYRGQAVVFDGEVRRDAAGQYRFNFHVQVGGEVVRLELGDLALLELLPLQKPTRLLFGARLASVAREAGGGWVIRFERDSGVLLTDPGAVAASCPPPLDDELANLLERQAVWAAELP